MCEPARIGWYYRPGSPPRRQQRESLEAVLFLSSQVSALDPSFMGDVGIFWGEDSYIPVLENPV